MNNAFTQSYITDLKAEIKAVEGAILSQVLVPDEYARLVGKRSGLATALALFESILVALEKME